MEFIMKKIALLIITLNCTLLTSCASVVSGTHQTVSILTPPVQGAHCVLENNKGKWYVSKTPASVVVHRSYKDLLVSCDKPGYEKSVSSIKSKTKGEVLGNIILGGGIGAGIDTYNGSAYEYPLEIKIPLKVSKKTGSSSKKTVRVS
jgi:hypothetical protein